jgi:hypothetical protein
MTSKLKEMEFFKHFSNDPLTLTNKVQSCSVNFETLCTCFNPIDLQSLTSLKFRPFYFAILHNVPNFRLVDSLNKIT